MVEHQVADLRRRLTEIEKSISGITDRRVTVVAVTKTHPADVLEAVCEAGVAVIGENYAQEVRDKADAIERVRAGGAEVHFIGQLQTNKVRMIAPHVDVIQSVDRQSLIDEIARRAPGMRVLIQVDTSGGEGRGGCPPAEAANLVAAARGSGLIVEGLMTLGPNDPSLTRTSESFALVRCLADGLDLPVRSMGMSGDYHVAVAEGSTMVRIGSALLGERR